MTRSRRATATPRLLLAAAVAALLPAAGAAQDGAWLGVPPPGPLALPPALDVLSSGRFRAAPVTVPAGEERHAHLAGPRILEDLRTIVGFASASHEAGDRVWGRVSGFPAAGATAEWVAARFAEAGLVEVRVQRYEADARMWWPDGWEVRLLGSAALGGGTRDVVLRSAVPARGSEVPGGGLTAPLVYAGDVGAPPAVDVAGKVAVQRLEPESGAFSQRAAIQAGAEELARRGAVAVLNFIDQPGNMHVRDFSCGTCFNLGGEDGAFLRDVSERARRDGKLDDLRVRLSLEAGMRSGLDARNVLGIVPGDSDEVVIVNAHLDGWYDAAGDNGDGLAVLLALARHFSEPVNRPARTLAFVASGGHHSAGLNGPRNVVAMNPELAARAILVLNLEHVAQFLVDPDTFRPEPTEQPMGWGVTNMAPFLLDLTDRGVERYGFRLRPEYSESVPGDLGGYAPLGVPRVQAIHAGPLYHTSADVLQTISVEGLERAARFYAFFVDGVARAPRERIDP